MSLVHRAPHLALDVFLQFHAQGAVVPCRAGTAVDLPGGEYKAPSLRQGNNGVDPRGRCGHGTSLQFKNAATCCGLKTRFCSHQVTPRSGFPCNQHLSLTIILNTRQNLTVRHPQPPHSPRLLRGSFAVFTFLLVLSGCALVTPQTGGPAAGQPLQIVTSIYPLNFVAKIGSASCRENVT